MIKIKKLNEKGFAHWLVPALVITIVAAIGVYALRGSFAASPTWKNYFSVSTQNVKATLTRDNPNYALMTKDGSGYTTGLLYGKGFTISNKTAGGYELYSSSGSQGVSFYESSSGMANNHTYKIHTYINPNNANGKYTGSYVLKYNPPGSSDWVNGPTIKYDVTLTDSIYTNYLTVSPKKVSITLSKTQASGGLVYGSGPIIKGVQSTSFNVYNNQTTQGQGFYISSGGISAGQSTNIQTYMNVNKPDGVYTGTATLRYYVSALQKWENGPTLSYTITLTN